MKNTHRQIRCLEVIDGINNAPLEITVIYKYSAIGALYGEDCSFGEECSFGEDCSFGDVLLFRQVVLFQQAVLFR